MPDPTLPDLLAWCRSWIAYNDDSGREDTPEADMWKALERVLESMQWRPIAEAPTAASVPDDIRAAGWAVAVHNDYRQQGEPHTFWLFTKNGRCVKGEGRTDAEALSQVRADLTYRTLLPPPPAPETDR